MTQLASIWSPAHQPDQSEGTAGPGPPRHGRQVTAPVSPVAGTPWTPSAPPSPRVADLRPSRPGEAGGGSRPAGPAPERLRTGSLLLGIPLTTIVVAELAAGALLLVPDLPVAGAITVVAAAILVAAFALVSVRGQRLGTLLAGGFGFLARRHAVAAQPAVPGADADSADGDVPLVPIEVRAFFAGLTVRRCATREGEPLGLIEWRGTWSATVAVTTRSTDPLSGGEDVRLPLGQIVRSLLDPALSVDAVQITTLSLGSEPTRFGANAISRVAAELSSVGPVLRRREQFVTIRIKPIEAASALKIRGGGFIGLERLASAALGRLRAELAAVGLIARPLDSDAAMRAMAASLLEPPAPDGAPVQWVETWTAVGSPRVQHRSFVVSGWGTEALDVVSAGAGYGTSVTHEFRRLEADDSFRCVTVIRLSAHTVAHLDVATRQLRAACRSAGVGVRLLRGKQADALRMTIPGGSR